MSIKISRISPPGKKENQLFICSSSEQFKLIGLSAEELAFVEQQVSKKNHWIEINRYGHWVFVQLIEAANTDSATHEACRKAGHAAFKKLNALKLEQLLVQNVEATTECCLAFVEGMALTSYQFLKYFKDAKEKKHALTEVKVLKSQFSEQAIVQLTSVVEGTCHARTLVNEPLSFLTATQMAKEFQAMSKEAGFQVEVLGKKKIETLKMGGLLAVNKGSLDPPTFSILEWKPAKPTNKKPIVLVGKGVVYDTGGLSLKPTPNSMDEMKCDMGGAAAVAGAIYAVAKAKLPVHVIGLIPATDNRPSGNAYVPGDVITMYNGSTVEVLNTDAEGRMLLADALTYAQKYKPELVIDLATLTGSAMRAIGIHGIVSMGTAEAEKHDALKASGANVYERLAELPFWDEYGEEMKSDIADLKNLGGANAGAISAGKFLEHFTKDKKGKHAYPWIHLDIAGPAFVGSEHNYRGKWGTGVGVRLLFDFLKNN